MSLWKIAKKGWSCFATDSKAAIFAGMSGSWTASRMILNDFDVGVAYFLPVSTFWTYIMTLSQTSWARTTTGTFSSHLCLQNFRGNTILPVISVKSSFLAGESTNSQYKDERTSSTFHSDACAPVLNALWTTCSPQEPTLIKADAFSPAWQMCSCNKSWNFQLTSKTWFFLSKRIFI